MCNVNPPEGYTERYMAFSNDHTMSMEALVKPDADLEDAIRVWDVDAGQFEGLNGWMWNFERVEPDNENGGHDGEGS